MTAPHTLAGHHWGESYVKLTHASHAWWLFSRRRRLHQQDGHLFLKGYPVTAIKAEGHLVRLVLDSDNWVMLTRDEYNRAMQDIGLEGNPWTPK